MGGILFELIFHVATAVVFLVAIILTYSLVRKLYGGKMTNSLPYLMMGVVLLFGMVVLDLFDVLYPVLDGSEAYLHASQILQLLGGFFILKALYLIYQNKYLTAGFIGGVK